MVKQSSFNTSYLIYFFIIISNLGIMLSLFGFNSFRYLMYSPFLLGVIFLFKNNFILNNVGFKKKGLNTAFLLLIMNAILHFTTLSSNGVFQLIFILSSLLPVITKDNFQINWRLFSIIYIFSFTVYLFSSGLILNPSLDAFFTSSSSNLETNQHPFVFGILTLFFLFKRDKLFFLLNLLFVLLSFKRIVFLAVIISIPFVLLERKNIRVLKNIRWVFMVINILFIRLLYLFSNGYFDDMIISITGISPGYFSMGRNTIYSLIFDYYDKFNFFQFLFGKGQGDLYSKSLIFIGEAPHNDLLVLLLDHGVIIFIVFFFLIYQKKNLIFNIIYLNVLFLTDNVLVYAFFLFPFFLINTEINTIRKNLNLSQ